MDEGTGDYVNKMLLATLTDHNMYVFKQAMLFMTNESQDRLVDDITKFRTAIQSTRVTQGSSDSSGKAQTGR